MNQYQNETLTRQRRDSVTVADTTARKIDTQNNKTITGHRRDRDNRETTVTTAQNTGTGHQRDRDKTATKVTTERRSTCYITSKLATK